MSSSNSSFIKIYCARTSISCSAEIIYLSLYGKGGAFSLCLLFKCT